MKKITLLFLFLVSGFTASAQFPESFEGATFPPAGWVSFIGANGEGTAFNWASATPAAATVGLDGTKTAFVRYEVVATSAEDWLVSPLVAITAGNPNLTFSDAQQFTVAYNSVYDVRISTTSQTDMMSFTTVSSRDESALSFIGTVGLTPQTIDLSAYVGQSVYIAFVMTNNDGDNWFLDNVNAGEPLLPCLGNTFMFPFTAVTTGACDGFTPTLISASSWAGDYAEINVVTGETYTFSSSVATDYLTISTDGNLTAAAFGLQPLTWVSTVDGVIRLNINADSSCATEDVNRETSVICGIPCLNGGLYPAATYTPAVCDGLTVNVINTDAYEGEYANVQVFALTPYTFGSSVATDYITIASADGTTVYTASVGTASYTPTADGVVRMYIHTDANCGVNTVNRERTVICSATVAAPECAINPTPADGATGISGLDPVVFSWEPSPTGGTPASYNFYGGVDPAALNFFANVTDPTYTIAVGAYDLTIYWVAVPLNAAGEAIGCINTPWSATSESDPLANTIFDNGTFAAVPNPVKDILNITFSQNIEKVQVMNLLGQEVMTKAINATQSQVDMSSLAQGTYLVKVTADGQVKTIKVIKE